MSVFEMAGARGRDLAKCDGV